MVRVALCLAFGMRLLAAGTNVPPFLPTLPDDSLWPQGRYVYQRNCVFCHGRFGDGRGEMGRDLRPQPRNFGRGLFKYRSTPAGALPTDEDLARTIRGGLAQTAMPTFSHLSDREVKSAIEYVKSFSARWRNPTNYAPAMVLSPLPEWFEDPRAVKARGEQGHLLFNMACAACHGLDGSGRGATAQDLRDSWDQPAWVSDLRQPQLRSGRDPEAIYRVLLTGIDGSPMPSFAESTTEEQRWQLVAFILELRREEAAKVN
jgi:mono/diheme cytochrome c family protein